MLLRGAAKQASSSALDFHYNTRNVLTKPVSFMKQQKLYEKKDRFESSEPIYKKVRQVRALVDAIFG